MTNRITLLFIAFIVAISSFSQDKVYIFRNCQKEMRTVTFQEQVNILWKCVSGFTTIKKQKILNFSPDYKLDTIQFEKQIEKVKKTLPSNFFKGYDFLGNWFDNSPDEKAIWFITIFAKKDDNGNYKIYSAIKVTFNGTDANVDEQRENPKIKNLQFIFEQSELANLARKLKNSKEAGLE
jgi:hypothetical protein